MGGGVILNERWILTAAHVVDGTVVASDITVHAGSMDRRQDNWGQRILVDQIIIHEGWNGDYKNGNDIALLRLSCPLFFDESVKAINFSPSAAMYEVGSLAKVSGWGRYLPNDPDLNEVLQTAEIPIISNATAVTKWCGTVTLSPFTFSLFDSEKKKAVAPGDSGGPIYKVINGSPVLLGIVSWGCSDGGLPVLGYADNHTKVLDFTSFISSNIAFEPCFACPNHTIHFSDQLPIITQPTTFNANVIVEPGCRLIIKSDIKMAKDKFIIVRPGAQLEVDGGKITSCGNDPWGAIHNQGSVIIKNNATIENSKFGIRTIGTPATISVSDANFVNNGYGIIIINSNTNLNIKYTTFSGGEYGVYLDRSKIVPRFNNCTFSYQAKNGIHAINSEINVQNGNSFIGCDNGISVSNLIGNSTVSDIGVANNSSANTFINNNKGLYTINSDLNITNNFFNTSASGIGIHYSGQNIFSSENNTFDGNMYAEGMNSTGGNTNQSRNNIYNSDVGIFPWQQNSRYSFIDNCFSTTWWDVNVPIGSTISPSQGSANYAASNCFTKNAVTDFICETAGIVTYNVPSNASLAPACMYPVKPGEGTPSGNYKTVQADGYDNNGCGGANQVAPNEYQNIINMGCDSVKLNRVIGQLKQWITILRSQPQPLSDNDRWFLYYLERHLVFAMQQKAWCLRKVGKKGQLKELYNVWAAFFPTESYPRIKSAEVSYELGNTSQAHSELNTLATDIPAKQNAIAAIKLSFDVMTAINAQPMAIDTVTSSTPLYTLSSNQYNLLVNVAQSSDPDAAYGRALLGYLTGEYIDPYVDYTITPRTRKQDVTNDREVVKCMPNPTSDYLNVIIDKMDEKATYRYDMIDINGRMLLTGSLQAINQIDASILTNGVYVLKITKDDIIMERQKIIIQK
jgi:hypothetical protein